MHFLTYARLFRNLIVSKPAYHLQDLNSNEKKVEIYIKPFFESFLLHIIKNQTL